MKISRNAPCPCGSGKKYKKCCLNKSKQTFFSPAFASQNQLEPHLHLVKSVIWKGYRWRALWNRLYPCPEKQSFHEFIIGLLKSTFGQTWFSLQTGVPNGEKHILIHWLKAYDDWKRVHQTADYKIDEYSWGAEPSGEVMALHAFAYDLFCLQAVNRLPNFLVKRLKNRNEFQGARYEVAVAAIIARAGFEITFLDYEIKTRKHCEFIAKNKFSGEEIGVEAKSRRRKGVLHEKGQLDTSSIIKGDIQSLFENACSQKPDDIPYFIFIDLNVLPTPNIPFEKKPWLNDIKMMKDKYGVASEGNPDIYNALIFTNFCHYYEGNTNIASSTEYLTIISFYPTNPLKDRTVMDEILESLKRYSYIPEEV